MFGKNKNKNKKVKKTEMLKTYKNLLKESKIKNDHEILKREQELRAEIKQEQDLKRIYEHYLKLQREYLNENKSNSEIEMKLVELSHLIIDVSNAHYRLKKRQKLEEILTKSEIEAINLQIEQEQNAVDFMKTI